MGGLHRYQQIRLQGPRQHLCPWGVSAHWCLARQQPLVYLSPDQVLSSVPRARPQGPGGRSQPTLKLLLCLRPYQVPSLWIQCCKKATKVTSSYVPTSQTPHPKGKGGPGQTPPFQWLCLPVC